MGKKNVYFKINTPAFLKEVVDNALGKNMGILKVPLNIFTPTRKNIVRLHGSPPFVDLKYTTYTQWRKAMSRLVSYFLTSDEMLLLKREILIHNEITIDDLKKHLEA